MLSKPTKMSSRYLELNREACRLVMCVTREAMKIMHHDATTLQVSDGN